MKYAHKCVKLDWSKLVGFNHAKTVADKAHLKAVKAMVGGKGGGPPP